MKVPTDIKDLGTLTGPLLLFGGAYSNLQALEALRADAEHLGIPPANVICTGDTPGYCADPAASLDLVERWGIHAIAGNVETNLVEGGDDCGCGFGDGSRCDMFAKLWYTFAAANVTPENLAYMAELPDILLFNYAGRRVAVLHGSPSNQSEFVWASTDPERKADYLKDLDADVIIGGHSGLPFTDYLDGQQSIWLNPGVIGMPANDATPRTWYATLNDTDGILKITYHPLHYNHTAAKARMLDRPSLTRQLRGHPDNRHLGQHGDHAAGRRSPTGHPPRSGATITRLRTQWHGTCVRAQFKAVTAPQFDQTHHGQ